MAFGITKSDLRRWKQAIDKGEIAFLTHYWYDERFPHIKTVTKAGCKDLKKLAAWGRKHGLNPKWIHLREDGYSHFDLMGERQKEILAREGLQDQLHHFHAGKQENAGGAEV
ncbi:MAG TPA: hypothetical protein VIG80_07525 [Bacillaceae bacterium]